MMQPTVKGRLPQMQIFPDIMKKVLTLPVPHLHISSRIQQSSDYTRIGIVTGGVKECVHSAFIADVELRTGMEDHHDHFGISIEAGGIHERSCSVSIPHIHIRSGFHKLHENPGIGILLGSQ